ncbi:MAG: hypothetical protein CMQ40_09695 [Gammaproteobacteria bacterium]|nr:hypothetical protein [Gammaproteobacteria bacterium]
MSEIRATLVDFVKVLRASEIKVSPAETLDAMETMQLIGLKDREFLKTSLSMVLSKTPEEKDAFGNCFDNFFKFEKPKNDHEPGAAPPDQQDYSSENKQEQTDRKGGGSGEASGSSEEDSEEIDEETTLTPNSELGKLLLLGSRAELMVKIIEAGRKVEVKQIVVFTQKGLYTRKIMDDMGLKGLQDEVKELKNLKGKPETNLARKLEKGKEALREQVRDYVEKQFLLHADETGKELREELLKKVKLSNLEKRNFKDVQEIVVKMAKKLVAIHSKRRKVFKRGQLDVRKTLRSNMQFNGILFNLKWKSKKVDRPKVICICDVSGSVSNYSRFLLMFLYSLAEILPKVRSFAFSSDLGEVTTLFEKNNLEDAMAKTMRDYGNGSTDYGQMLEDFRSSILKDVNSRTTIIILGDARNNYGDPKSEILREMYDKAQRIIWLNPETRSSWSAGDSEMSKYSPACHQAEVCNSLVHLERVVANLLRYAR